ncbi:hypothetical protein NPIL_595641 [Nephila pilipes]|uniref:Uncharacterized protein n=1 Tax=Nephila pilipes TaxID=299642 RepID=A0A8X6N0L2_NEPPI|nr:hypothetical protein NPIL_595641 [Nephila pilipes]
MRANVQQRMPLSFNDFSVYYHCFSELLLFQGNFLLENSWEISYLLTMADGMDTSVSASVPPSSLPAEASACLDLQSHLTLDDCLDLVKQFDPNRYDLLTSVSQFLHDLDTRNFLFQIQSRNLLHIVLFIHRNAMILQTEHLIDY